MHFNMLMLLMKRAWKSRRSGGGFTPSTSHFDDEPECQWSPSEPIWGNDGVSLQRVKLMTTTWCMKLSSNVLQRHHSRRFENGRRLECLSGVDLARQPTASTCFSANCPYGAAALTPRCIMPRQRMPPSELTRCLCLLMAFVQCHFPIQRASSTALAIPPQMSGNVEGYLVKVDGDEGEIVYCILDEGILQYYSRMGGILLGAVPLTGCKVEVFLLPDESGQVLNRFRIDTQVKASRKRSLEPPTAANIIATKQQRKHSSITLAGSTHELTDRWAVSILNWNRYSWEDPQTLCSSKDEYETLKNFLKQSGVKCKTETVVPLGVSRAIQPI